MDDREELRRELLELREKVSQALSIVDHLIDTTGE
jgi:hypothetical protein